MQTQQQPTCKQLISGKWQVTAATLANLIESDRNGEEYCEDEATSLNEYGLSFDYVAPGTFTDQDEGYWRYQMSWGGPSDEIRFYSSDQRTLYRAEYWYMDWGDGASVDITKSDIASDLWGWFEPSVAHTYEQAFSD